jgi:ferredoxin
MVSKRIVLTFPHDLVGQPITYQLVKEHNLAFIILQAKITPKEEGVMVIEVSGKKDDCSAGIKYLTDLGIKIQPLSKDVTRIEEKCIHCGACVTICPTGALMEKERAYTGTAPAMVTTSMTSTSQSHPAPEPSR